MNTYQETKARVNGMDIQTIVEEKIVKKTGDVEIRKYIKGRLLGKGGFANCYELTSNDTKRIYAAKVVTKASLVKPKAKKKLISEIKIHRSLNHQQIVKYHHFFEDTENVYILLEMCQNQSLNELLKRRKRLTEIEVKCYLVQLIEAMKYLHSRLIIHRDLKLGNLFLTDKMELKVGDLGLATKLEFEGERKRTVCGTPNYIAPEILDGKSGHSYEVDIWSLGVICYTLIIGKPPFETQDLQTKCKRIKMNDYSFPDGAIISDAAKSLISEILITDPFKRPSLDQIIASDFFNHGTGIPKLLPTYTLSFAPALSYILLFMPDAGANGIVENVVSTSSLRIPTNQSGGVNKNIISERNKFGKNLMPQGSISNTNGQNLNIQVNPSSRPQTTSTNNRNNLIIKARVDSINSNFLGESNKIFNFNPGARKDDKKDSIPGILQAPDTWVIKWVDYCSKYGMAYLLSNGCTGVFFNDSSKIIFDPKGNNFNYIERRKSDKQEIVASYRLNEYPNDIQKKVILLHHFKSFLEGDISITNKTDLNHIRTSSNEMIKNPISTEDNFKNQEKKSNDFIYVEKWMRTTQAIMFRLSNKLVQVCFQDHTEIILSPESGVVSYLNKNGKRSTYQLSSAMDSNNQEMIKRLKYSKEFLTHMLTINMSYQIQTNIEKIN